VTLGFDGKVDREDQTSINFKVCSVFCFFSGMPPVRNIKRLAFSEASEPSSTTSSYIASSPAQGPSTWQVISAIGGAVWFTYSTYTHASQIWNWIQFKVAARQESRNKKVAEFEVEDPEPARRVRRNAPGAPLNSKVF
jgi:hypothetical protein